MRPKGLFPSAVHAMLTWYVERRVRRELDGVWVSGLRPELRRPCVLAPTHVTWWDAMLLVRLDRELGPASIAMHAHNLLRYPFFQVFGVFGIDATTPGGARRGLREATQRAKAGPLWWFPQGVQRPAHLRPLCLQGGILSLARQAGVPVIPVALSYPFREGRLPAAYLHFGEALPPETSLDSLEAALVAGLARIDDATDPTRSPDPDAPFTPLEPPQVHEPGESPWLRWLWLKVMGAPGG